MKSKFWPASVNDRRSRCSYALFPQLATPEMQPLYQIPGEMMNEHVAKLLHCPRVVQTPTRIYALLFLSGLRLTFKCFEVELAQGRGQSHLIPLHHLDDGLCETARSALLALVKRVRSRDLTTSVRGSLRKHEPLRM